MSSKSYRRSFRDFLEGELEEVQFGLLEVDAHLIENLANELAKLQLLFVLLQDELLYRGLFPFMLLDFFFQFGVLIPSERRFTSYLMKIL